MKREHRSMQQRYKQIFTCPVHYWGEVATRAKQRDSRREDLCKPGAIEELLGLNWVSTHLNGNNFHLRLGSSNYGRVNIFDLLIYYWSVVDLSEVFLIVTRGCVCISPPLNILDVGGARNTAVQATSWFPLCGRVCLYGCLGYYLPIWHKGVEWGGHAPSPTLWYARELGPAPSTSIPGHT